MANMSLVLDTSLELVPECSRYLFFWIILTIAVVTLVGNVFAITSIIKRKQKLLQKVCITSLALADIFSVTIFATNNLDALSRELKIWKLGEFMCHFIPMGQVLGTTASSMALLVIALDRYQNVTVAIVSQRWNPNLWTCLGVVVLCLVFCTVISYPMYVFFTHNPIQVVHTDMPEPVFEDAFLCAAIQKDKLKLYYIVTALVVFLPIVVTFTWFYYQIAVLVWRHRKPFISKYPLKTKTVQVQRKIRTFKVIIVLMAAFTVCRLPYWIFFVVKLVETIPGPSMWYLSFSLTALNMLSCALNPFLYPFLNQTLQVAKKCHDVASKATLYCCCFTQADFEGFRRNGPFGKESVGKCRIKFVDV
ncbi:hypothetical protein NQ315_001569 [Exocentrus adspersus]|uniref:G-protein coupled receptors family 1 profile domain-containing protein n=1 Tax=Exocentrus adspersus TaxID=1586481 RepID=A0AAV8WB81_9CUCU|nr:hypothetical protein NQ315_001569 [Exocentrus adspersus]